MTEKHFKFTREKMISEGKILHRIRATRSLPNGVKRGMTGGWIEKESNLSGNAWVFGEAWISGDAQVYGNAQVSDNAHIHGNARVYGNAEICGNVHVYGNAKVYGNAWVSDDAWVHGKAQVHGNAKVQDTARVHGNAEVEGIARVFGYADISGTAWLGGTADVGDTASVGCNVKISSKNDLILFNPTNWYSVTITKEIIFIGCESFPVSKLNKSQWKLAEKNGFTKEGYKTYKKLIKESLKLIK